jgi:pimeloyl-ACP methyl ester carboxylesterase
VRVPVTHVWSDRDDALGWRTAQEAHRWADGDFELRVLEGHSHWLPEQAPAELADIVLDRVLGRTGSSQDTAAR